jgi:hypothetical protein
MSRFIGQSLALEALQGNFGPLYVIDAEFCASVHAEIEFGQVPMKVLLVHVLVDSNQAALENRKVTFKGVGMNVAARPLKLRVIDRLVLRFVGHHGEVGFGAIGEQAAIFVQVAVDSTAHISMVQVHGADVSAAFDQREYHRRGFGMQGGPSWFTGLGRLAEIGFVSFNGLARTTDQIAVILHGFADAMPQEPSGLHAAIEHPLNLASADAFLAGTHQMDDLKPEVKRQMAGFEYGAHADGERFLADVAFAESGTSGFAVQATDALSFPAMRANRTIGPEMRFDVFESTGFGFELGGGKDRGGHGGISYGLNCGLGA